MKREVVVTGTDTGVGKTVVAAGLAGLLSAAYWKPVQAGLDGETDSETARRLGGLDASRVLAEAYRLRMPASPHHAAALEGVTIDLDRLAIPQRTDRLVIEGAGGLMVPLTGTRTFLDLFARWHVPVVLCARTRLGTINHTLLALEALRRRDVPILGVVLVGDAAPESEAIIATLGAVSALGRLPWLEPLTAAGLREEMKPISARIAQALDAC